MKDLVTIAIAQFSMIFLLGIQSLNIKDGHIYLAGIVSALLSIAGFYVTGLTAKAFENGITSWFGVVFVVSGSIGIMTAMKFHNKIVKIYKRFVSH